ncbi:DNA methyltransferase [Pectobacterium carotovorum]|uniref:DNA methyltransferase n=1 Tax=Pectobacterium carotovorum TaxID=554 RepID=UPI0032EBB924
MQKTTLICGNAAEYSISADIILTDPPFDMPGDELCEIIKTQQSRHLILITTMRQFLELYGLLGWNLAFDFVLDAVAPKKSRSSKQPHYTHHTGVYLYAPGEKSLFDRKRRQRSDVFEGNGYWPTIFHAPRERSAEHGMAKNMDSVTDLLGSFNVRSVLDLFAGSGTTGLAAFELGVDCVMVEKELSSCDEIADKFQFLGANFNFQRVFDGKAK